MPLCAVPYDLPAEFILKIITTDKTPPIKMSQIDVINSNFATTNGYYVDKRKRVRMLHDSAKETAKHETKRMKVDSVNDDVLL